MNRTELLKRFQNSCGYMFKNENLLNEALTHDSNRVNDRNVPSYQRLEFLGDSVLNLVVSEYLFRTYPNYTEGQLTDKRKELTEARRQTQIAEKLNLRDHILFGQSIVRDQYTGHHKFVESLIGAVYIDSGLEAARGFIRRLWELPDGASAAAGCILS